MPKRVLIERVGSLQLKESKSQTRPGCLGTLIGPCADFKNPTRNGNFYSRRLWENSFNNPLVKESFEDLTMIGELDHPGDRLETKATNACIVMTGYEFDDNNGLVIGTFDILNTPNGRLLKSLLDYGCKIGVSSRGEGDVEEESDRVVVDEDGFDLVAFDAVVLPAVKTAKPSLKESYHHLSLKESLQKEVDSAQTTAELNLIKNVVETINLPDSDSLLESVDHKSQELSSGTTSSTTLIEDLEKATSQIQELTEEVSRLKSDLATCKSKYYRQIGSRQKIVQESVTQRGKVKDLNAKYKALVFESASSSQELISLREANEKYLSKIHNMRSRLRESAQKSQETESRVGRLQKSLSESQKFGQDKLDEIARLNEEVKSLRREKDRQLQESENRRQSDTDKLRSQVTNLKENYSQVLEAFIDAKCRSSGVSPKEIRESLKAAGRKDLSTVTKLVESKASQVERYKTMPIVNDGLINLLEEGTLQFSSGRQDEELAQTISFMSEANKLF